MRFLRSDLIEVLDRGTKDTMQLLLLEEEQVIETLSPHTQEKAFTKDQPLLKELTRHLKPLERSGLITVWADIDINAGTEWEREIEKHLEGAHIILLLISSSFIASDHAYSKEMIRAIK